MVATSREIYLNTTQHKSLNQIISCHLRSCEVSNQQTDESLKKSQRESKKAIYLVDKTKIIEEKKL